MAEIICRPYVTLKNGRKLYASEYGLQAFCFPASLGYWERRKQKELAKTANS